MHFIQSLLSYCLNFEQNLNFLKLLLKFWNLFNISSTEFNDSYLNFFEFYFYF